MDALDFLKEKGDVYCTTVAERAGTTLAYLKQIAYRYRRPSVRLARALEQSSGGELSATGMLFADIKKQQLDAATGTDR